MNKSVVLDYLKVKQDVVDYMITLEDVLHTFKGIVIEPVLEKFLKSGMPVPLLGGWRDWTHGELAKLINKEGMLLGIGTVDTSSRSIRMKRLINS
jgi:hypothetical protein